MFLSDHSCIKVAPHCLDAFLNNFHGWADKWVAFSVKDFEFAKAAKGVGEGENGVVAYVKLSETHKQADGRWDGMQVMEVLTDV